VKCRCSRSATANEELSELNVQPLDPGEGMALVPFVQDNQLSWYVFDPFDSQPIGSWRYQSDPDETRRALTARPGGPLL
jgi:hypothetical protein